MEKKVLPWDGIRNMLYKVYEKLLYNDSCDSCAFEKC